MSIENIYPDIMPYINSYINPIDVMEFWENAPESIHQKGELVLKIEQDDILELLKKIEYQKFLDYIINRIQLDDSTKPIFLSESDKEIYPRLKHTINVDREKVKIVLVESKKQYEIETTNFMSQVLYTPLSQIHAYLLLTLEQFQKRKKKLAPYKAKMYLNAKGFSQLTNFIQEWCFEKLGIEKEQQNGFVVSGPKDIEKLGRPW